ncbi:MAG TPA: DUF4384 domain-containing protein [Longimicrobium sp.]|jgi:hypothetical protein
MRTTLLAALTLLAFGATEGAASVADTSRAVPAPNAPVEEIAPGPLQAPRVVQLSAGFDDRSQDGYDRRDQDRRLGVRVWMDDDRDVYRVGDRSRVLVRTDRDAYVAVLHIDTNGDVEVLHPRSPGDDGYLRGGRTHHLSPRGYSHLSVRGGYGIGYVFAVASDEPLDSRVLRDLYYRRAGSWSSDYSVYGDPFRAMDRFERMLVGDYDYGEHDSDYYSYHVGRRYTHPRYACYDSYGSWYSHRGAYYDSCDRVRVLLVQVPYYYDTRYYRGDRRVYYYGRNNGYYDDRYGRRTQPTHGYKERTDVRDDAGQRRTETRRPTPPAARGAGTYTADRDAQQEPRVTRPERTRPTFERRPPEASPETRRAEPPPRREEPRREAPRREEVRREEPRREAPRREEPRRESRPSRESAPAERSSPRVRPPSE